MSAQDYYSVTLTSSGSTLYALASGASDRNSLLAALDANTGRILWKYEEHRDKIWKLVVAHGVLYMVVGLNTLQTLDASRGKPLWNRSTGEYQIHQIAVTSKAIYITQNKFYDLNSTDRNFYEFVRAVRLSDGADIWKGEPEKTNSTEYLQLQADDQAVYVLKPSGAGNILPKTLVALDAQTGATLWSFQQQPYETDSPFALTLDLLLHENVLYLVGAYHLTALSPQDGRVLRAYTTHIRIASFVPKDHLFGSIVEQVGRFCLSFVR